MPLVLDLLLDHERWGSSADPNLNGNLHYPNDKDRSLIEAAADKIRKYRSDYNNRPPNPISFMFPIVSTSGRLHSEFITLLFLQTHRETDHFFTASGVQLAQTNVASSTSAVLLCSNVGLEIFSPRLQFYVLILT